MSDDDEIELPTLAEWLLQNLPAEKLSECFKEFGGRPHYLPKLKNCKASRDARNTRIWSAWKAAVPNDRIAKEHGLHLRTVELIVESLRKAATTHDAA